MSSRLVRVSEDRRAGRADGPDRCADRDSERQRCCCSAAVWATPCCSRSRKALHERGNRVLYFAGYKKGEDLFKREDIEAATDQVDVEHGDRRGDRPHAAAGCPLPGEHRPGHARVSARRTGERLVPLPTVDRIIAIGSDRMMAAVKAARHGVLTPYLKHDHIGIVSINSPMQCMMKEVCAQCLQRHVDPATGQRTIVFSCFNQDQEMDRVDFQNLAARLRQNTVQEKLADMWLDLLLDGQTVPHV